MNKDQTLKFVDQNFEQFLVQPLQDFVRVPNLTPMVDKDFITNGLIEQAMAVVDKFIEKIQIKGLSYKKFQPQGMTPLIVYVVEPSEGVTKNLMFYGHLDKQPYGEGWNTDPLDPVIIDNYMYGRGSSDDGYSVFSCMLAVKAAQEQGVKLPRIVLVLETEEESGSPNLISLLKEASELIQNPDICICLDSGAFDYNQLWLTSSLRGICIVDLEVQVGQNGYHSGEVGGIVPETFRVIRTLIDRVDDSKTGQVTSEFDCQLPEWKKKEVEQIVSQFGKELYSKFLLQDGVQVMEQDKLDQLYLNNIWRANLSITGADFLPPIKMAGNVVRNKTAVRLSLRLPPNFDPKKAEQILIEKLTTNVPYNAQVTLHTGHSGKGWCMKDLNPWFDQSIKQAGTDFFNNQVGSFGMGGSIPFLSELEKIYPSSQIIAFGVLGPQSNAHGPNENVNLPYVQKLTCSLAHIIADCAQN